MPNQPQHERSKREMARLRRRVAHEAVSILLGLPQRSPDAPQVVPTQAAERLTLGHQVAPSVYPQEPIDAGYLRADGKPRANVGVAHPGATRKAEKPSNSMAWLNHATRARSRRVSRLPANRGGKGGRQARAATGNEATAVQEVFDAYGPPTNVTRHRGCAMYEWWHPGGDGIVFARMSGSEVQNGSTARFQIATNLAFAAANNLRPRLLVLTLENSGFTDYDRRPEFSLTERIIEEGWLRWVLWRGVDRIAREHHPAEEYWKLLRDNRVDLWIDNGFGRQVDWETDAVALRAMLLAFRLEGRTIRDRTHGKLKETWLEQGRGWPNAKRYATVRGPEKFLVEDEEQMLIVRFVHERFGEVHTKQRAGQRQLAKEVEEQFGVTLSSKTVNRILRDPIYVTGEWYTVYDGVAYQGRPIPWTEPVPLELWQRNQQLLLLRGGRHSKTPEGTFCLNGLLVHARCDGQRCKRGRVLVKLRGKCASRNKTPTYYHSPNTPEGCEGFAVVQAPIEALVMAELRKLVRDPEILAAWRAANRNRSVDGEDGDAGERAGILSPEATASIETKIEHLQAQVALIVARQTQAIEDGNGLDLMSFDQLVQGCENRINELRQKLRTSAVLAEHAQTRKDVELPDASTAALLARVEELLTDDVPEEEDKRLARAALVQTLLSKVVVDDRDPEHLTVRLYGWLASPAEVKAVERETAIGPNGQRQLVRVLMHQLGPALEPLREVVQGAAEPTVPTGSHGTACDPVGNTGRRQLVAADLPEVRVKKRSVTLNAGLTVETDETEVVVRGVANARELGSLSRVSDIQKLGIQRHYEAEKGVAHMWEAPELRLPREAVTKLTGQWTFLDVRRAMDLVAQRLPAHLDRITKNAYIDAWFADKSLPGYGTVTQLCRDNDHFFEHLAHEALAAARAGTDLPVRRPKVSLAGARSRREAQKAAASSPAG